MTSGGELVTHTVLLHRLALGVETVDAVTGRAVGTAVRVGREVPDQPRRRHRGQGLDPMLRRTDLPLEASSTGRYRLRHELRRRPVPPPRNGVPPAPAPVVVRIDDPSRRFVPRRLAVPLWTLAEVEAAEAAGGHIPVRSRLLRPRLLPGSAYVLPRGVTGLRGRVRDAAGPLPWARVEARIEDQPPDEVIVGRAHGDERGEFLLVVTTLGDVDLALRREVLLRIVVFGPAPVPASVPVPAPSPAAGDEDRLSRLPVEPVPRAAGAPPPTEADLDTALMRGETPPPGYQQSSADRRVRVPVGGMRSEPTPFLFSP
ncbi:hypothetical protein [Streptomyces sp. NPDC047525]|uniref:hypothetical protein n=1 Tax=Streptomyces sp. NPDC047525 TaxID=3155264 RepID=UPI0033C4746A